MTRPELVEMIRVQPFIVYGNGYVAHRFYNCIQRLNAESNLIGFVVTHVKDGDIGADGKSVMDIADVKDTKVPLFIAAHDAVAEEMKRTAEAKGFQNILWIYPLLWELELGEPVEKRRRISTRELVAMQRFYNIAIDYLTIQHFMDGKCDELYKKMQSVWSTSDVAEKRLENFKFRIKAAQNGYDMDSAVKINERYELFDGMHSTALAMYFGIEEIYADVYPAEQSLYAGEAIYRRGVLMEEDLPKYYSNDEISEIQTIYQKLRGL